jgi:3-oxoacyl-[acyl-carrier-protein] synthase-3
MYVPDEVLDNQHFINYLDTTDEWIRTRSGILERRRVAPNESTSTMAAEAAKRALEAAGLAPTDLGLIVCATATGDCQFPATATFVQHALGADGVPAFDVNAACAGFLYGLCVGASMLSAQACKYALVIGAETLTRFVDPEDRATIVLFGDAAGAAILGPAENPDQSILYCDMGTDGSRAELIWVPAGGSRLPASQMTVAERLHFMRMKGREVYKFAVTKLQELIDNALTVTGLKPEDLKLVIPHQSNLRIIESARERLGLPPEKVAINIDRYGNTSAASVIMGLDECIRDGTLQRGDIVLMVGIGAGLTWGTAVVRL